MLPLCKKQILKHYKQANTKNFKFGENVFKSQKKTICFQVNTKLNVFLNLSTSEMNTAT